MIHLLTIIGARPQIIKAAAVSRAIRNHFSDRIEEHILHTGQHYDDRMSQVFFDELGIPKPEFQLNVGSASHGAQTAAMLTGIEEVLSANKIDAVLVYGDTNSTLAGALAGAKMHIPVMHVEAGLRSFNKKMPEEINRIACDHSSTLLFSPTKTGVENLRKEGFSTDNRPPFSMDTPGVFHCGDVMYDNSMHYAKQSDGRETALQLPDAFALVTIHRPYNTDDADRLRALLDGLLSFGEKKSLTLYVPMHPRTRNKLKEAAPEWLDSWQQHPLVRLVEPVSFLDMICLEKNARMIVTDSGGVQKEAYFFEKPSVVVRSETEWTELVEHGSAVLAFQTGQSFLDALDAAYGFTKEEYPPIFGDGTAARFICEQIIAHFA